MATLINKIISSKFYNSLPWAIRRFIFIYSSNPIRSLKKLLGIYNIIPFPAPQQASVEITNACNLKCIMCGQRYMKRPIGYMDLATYKKVLQKITPYCNQLLLYSTGEPLLHPRLFKMIKIAHSSGVDKVTVSTNATLLDSEKRKKFLSEEFSPEVIQLSVEGWDPKTYEYYRKGACFEEVYKKIKNFYHQRKNLSKKKPKITIHLLVTKKTNIEAFVKLWGKWCDEIRVSLMYPPNFFKTLEGGENILYDFPLYRGCIQPFEKITVSYDGKLGVCCNDFDFKLKIGDLVKNSLLDLWRTRKYQDLRKALWKGTIEESICVGCNMVYTNRPVREKIQAKVNKLLVSVKEKCNQD